MEVDLPEPAVRLTAGTAAELESRDVICLGIIERQHGNRVWISVEHLLNRESLNALRALWGEQQTAEDMD